MICHAPSHLDKILRERSGWRPAGDFSFSFAHGASDADRPNA